MDPRRRAVVTVVLSLCLLGGAGLVGFLSGWLVGDHSMREWLLSYAGATEFFGVVLVATPELVPCVQRLASVVAIGGMKLWATLRRAWDAVRRLIGQPRSKVVSVSAAGTATATGSLSACASVSPGASLSERVEYLLRRDKEAQARLERMETALGDMPGQWQSDIDKTATGLRSEYAEALERLRDRHLKARLLGVALVLVGIGLGTSGNLS